MNKMIKKFFSYYRPYKKTLFMDLFCAILNASVSLLIPWMLRYILNDALYSFEKTKVLQNVSFFSFCILIAFLVMFLCNYYIVYYGHILGAKIEKDMREELFTHYQKLSMNFYDNQKIGDLMSRITNDLNDISELMHRAPEEITVLFFRFTGTIAILFIVNWMLTLITLAVLSILLGYVFYMMPKLHNAFVENHKKMSDINHQAQESLAGIKIVKSFANENVEISRFKTINQKFFNSRKKTYAVMARFFPVMTTFITGITPIVTVLSFAFIFNGIMTTDNIADILTFMLYLSILVGPIFMLLALSEQFQDSSAGFKRFIEILSIKSDINDKLDAIELTKVDGRVDFKNVSFAYHKNEKPIFENINLSIKPREYIALVGSSGVGKSTLCNLIPRLYDVSHGKVTIDNIDVKDIKIKDLRRNIGFVHQETYLFANTIAENIKYGNENATQEEIIEASKKAYAHDFIINLPDGYDTNVGQRGLRLSGGQKQRISIARVFLQNPQILIFDEATSSLDNESEKYIQKSLEELSKSKTTIVIAHRLSTIRNAKKIIVLTKNGIAEQGTHKTLIASKGIYYNFYHLIS